MKKRFVVLKLMQVKEEVVEKPVFYSETYKEAEEWQWEQQEPHKFYIEDTLYPEGHNIADNIEYDFAD